MSGTPKLRIDVHCHVGLPQLPTLPDERFSFEPAGQYAPFDAYFSPHFRSSIGMQLGLRLFGLNPRDPDLATAIESRLLGDILGATTIDRAVVLAFDQYHSSDGQPLGPRRGHRFVGSDLYVSNTYVRSLARRHPQRILFGASIHPYRSGATAMLEEAAAAGAVLIKWLPPAQNIDPRDPRTIEFLRHCARIGMPLLIHQGGEMAIGNLHPEHSDPAPLLTTVRALRDEGRMPTVIVAHAATPSMWFGSGQGFRTLTAALLGEFADAPLYADVSALAVCSRGRWLKRLTSMPHMHGKLVYGSDFPVPPTAVYWLPQLGRKYRSIRALRSSIDRDVAIKRAIGLPEHVFTRGSDLLADRMPHHAGT